MFGPLAMLIFLALHSNEKRPLVKVAWLGPNDLYIVSNLYFV